MATLTASQQKQLESIKQQALKIQKALNERTVSYGTSSSGKPLSSTGSKLDTSQGQTLKDYSIAFASGGSGKSSGSKVTSDSSSAVNYENSIKADLEKYQRDLERQIERERRALEARRKEETGAINTNFDEQRTATEYQQKRETGQTSVDLARAGGYLGVTASQSGVLQQLANNQRQELASLENDREAALRAANNAYEDRDFELVREKLKSARDIEQEIYNRTQEYNAQIQDALKAEQEKLAKTQEQTDIYNAIQTTGSQDVGSIFQALNGAVPVENIRSFLNNLVPKSAVGGDGAFTFTGTNVAKLLGAGMGQDDIIAFNEYVNENGYTDELRATLTPAQRAAADAIFRDVKNTTGTSDVTKPMTILDLQRIQETYGVLFPLGVTAGEVTQFLRDNIGKSASEMQEAIDAIFGPQDESNPLGRNSDGFKIEISEEWLRKTLSTTQLKKLADLVNASAWYTGKETDINRMFNDPKFLTQLQEKVDEARALGLSDTEILLALTG